MPFDQLDNSGGVDDGNGGSELGDVSHSESSTDYIESGNRVVGTHWLEDDFV